MRQIKISYYSTSKDEYVPIEDMNHEHLVNVIYKSVLKKEEYLANFKIETTEKSPRQCEGTLNMGVSSNFIDTLEDSEDVLTKEELILMQEALTT